MNQLLISWTPAVVWAGFLFLLSSRPFLPGPPGLPLADKLLHLVLYLILGTTLVWAGRRNMSRGFFLALALSGVLFAASDEWHQGFVPGRDPSVGDLMADVVGLFLGFALALRLFSRSHPRSSRGPSQ